jgi:hypothetical protein
VGHGRRRVQPALVPGRHGQGRDALERTVVLLPGPMIVHQAGLHDAGGQGHAGTHPAALRVLGGTGVRARVVRLPHAAAVERAPRRAQALGTSCACHKFWLSYKFPTMFMSDMPSC